MFGIKALRRRVAELEERKVAKCAVCNLMGFENKMLAVSCEYNWSDKAHRWEEKIIKCVHPHCTAGTKWDRRKAERGKGKKK